VQWLKAMPAIADLRNTLLYPTKDSMDPAMREQMAMLDQPPRPKAKRGRRYLPEFDMIE
jgi:hypothetical protein